MNQTHSPCQFGAFWDARADAFEQRLRNVVVWARQQGAEANGRSIDLPAATTLPGVVAIAFDRRLPTLGDDGASAFDLAGMPEQLAASLRSYVEETGSYDPALSGDRQFSEYAFKLHFFTLMTAGQGLTERLS